MSFVFCTCQQISVPVEDCQLHGDRFRARKFSTPTVSCPYCTRPVERTVGPDDVHLLGEHCDCCALPFGVDENGNAYGQDDPRWLE